MAQKISMEEAFPTFQKRCTELFEENLVLRAQIDVQERKIDALERQLSAAREENARPQGPNGTPDPAAAGPDLAAVPPYPSGDDAS